MMLPGVLTPFDMNFFSAYEPKIGFRMNFEVMMNSPVRESIF